MESSSDGSAVGQTPQHELNEIGRSAERAHLEYPPSPLWVWPTLALAATTTTWSYSLGQPFPGMLVFWTVLAICWFVVFRITKTRGVFPSFSTMPAPLKRDVVFTWLQTALLVPVTIGVWQLLGPNLASILAGLSFAGITFAHQRRYDAIATRLRSESDETSNETT